MSGKFENAGRLDTKGSDSEPGEMFDGMDHLMVLVQINEIERKENAESVHALGGNHPKPFVELEFEFADEAFEAREGGVRRGDAEA